MNPSFHILLVDDDEDLLWCLQSVLGRAGHQLRAVLSGKEAINEVGSSAFDLAIVDAKLPDADGMDVAADIKKKQPHISVILISGYFYEDDTTIKEAIQEQVIDAFIAKPFDLEDVVQAVMSIKA